MTEKNTPAMGSSKKEYRHEISSKKEYRHEINVPGDLDTESTPSKMTLLKSKGLKFWLTSFLAIVLIGGAVVAGLMGQSGMFRGATTLTKQAPVQCDNFEVSIADNSGQGPFFVDENYNLKVKVSNGTNVEANYEVIYSSGETTYMGTETPYDYDDFKQDMLIAGDGTEYTVGFIPKEEGVYNLRVNVSPKNVDPQSNTTFVTQCANYTYSLDFPLKVEKKADNSQSCVDFTLGSSANNNEYTTNETHDLLLNLKNNYTDRRVVEITTNDTSIFGTVHSKSVQANAALGFSIPFTPTEAKDYSLEVTLKDTASGCTQTETISPLKAIAPVLNPLNCSEINQSTPKLIEVNQTADEINSPLEAGASYTNSYSVTTNNSEPVTVEVSLDNQNNNPYVLSYIKDGGTEQTVVDSEIITLDDEDLVLNVTLNAGNSEVNFEDVNLTVKTVANSVHESCDLFNDDLATTINITPTPPATLSCSEYKSKVNLRDSLTTTNILAEVSDADQRVNEYSYSDSNFPREDVKFSIVDSNGVEIDQSKYELYVHAGDAPLNYTSHKKDHPYTYPTIGSLVDIGVGVSLAEGDDFTGAKLILSYADSNEASGSCVIAEKNISSMWPASTPPPASDLCSYITVTPPNDPELLAPVEIGENYDLDFTINNSYSEAIELSVSSSDVTADGVFRDLAPETVTVPANSSSDVMVGYWPSAVGSDTFHLSLSNGTGNTACTSEVDPFTLETFDPNLNADCPYNSEITAAFDGLDPAATDYQAQFDIAVNTLSDALASADPASTIADLPNTCTVPETPATCTTEQQAAMDNIFTTAALDQNAENYDIDFAAYLASVSEYPESCTREAKIECSEAEQLYVNTEFSKLDANASSFDQDYTALVEIFTDHETYRTCTIPTKQQATSGVDPEDMITPEASLVNEDPLGMVDDTVNPPDGGSGVLPGNQGGTVIIPDTRPSAPVTGAANLGQSGAIQGSTGPGILLYPAFLSLAGLMAKWKKEEDDILLK